MYLVYPDKQALGSHFDAVCTDLNLRKIQVCKVNAFRIPCLADIRVIVRETEITDAQFSEAQSGKDHGFFAG